MALSNHLTPDIGDTMTAVAGKWRRRVQEGTPGAELRELTMGNNKGSTVWELGWPSLENVHLIGGKLIKNEQVGLQAEVIFKDFMCGETYVVSFGAKSRTLKTLIERLPNLDPDMAFNMELHPSRKKSASGATMYNLRVVQNGSSLESHYIKWHKDAQGNNVVECLNGCPEAVKDPVTEEWDFTEQTRFFLKVFKEYFDEYIPPHPNVDEITAYTPVKADDDDAPQLSHEDEVEPDNGEFDDIQF